MTDNSIPTFLQRKRTGETLREVNDRVKRMPGGGNLSGFVVHPRTPEPKDRFELTDAEAAKLAAKEAKFVEWQTADRPGAGKKKAASMRALAIAAFLLSAWSAEAATASKCVEKLPRDREGYWAYRLVRGKRCWYRAREGRVRVRPPRIESSSSTPVRVVPPDEFNEVDARAPPNYDYMFNESLDAFEPDFRRRGHSLGETHEFHLRFRGE